MGGGTTPTYERQEDIAPNTNYNITVKNGFVLLTNKVRTWEIWGAWVVQDGNVTALNQQTNTTYSYSNGVLTIKNGYTGYGNDNLDTYIYN